MEVGLEWKWWIVEKKDLGYVLKVKLIGFVDKLD